MITFKIFVSDALIMTYGVIYIGDSDQYKPSIAAELERVRIYHRICSDVDELGRVLLTESARHYIIDQSIANGIETDEEFFWRIEETIREYDSKGQIIFYSNGLENEGRHRDDVDFRNQKKWSANRLVGLLSLVLD